MFNSINVFILAVVTLLSCISHVSTFFVHPRISHTNEAKIIDFDPFLRGGIADPRYVPAPSSNLYPIGQSMDYNWWQHFRQSAPASQCGKGATATPKFRSSISERIAGGITAKKHVWAFMVTLNLNGVFFCSGTLLSAIKVLSAASCFEKMSLYEMSTVTVSVGGYLSDQSDVQMTRRVSRIVIHGQYNSATYANDIAIVTLDVPVTFSETVGPVCLPPTGTDPDDSAGQDAIILGWDKKVSAASPTCSTSGNCGEMCASVTSTGGVVQSPNFPSDYGNDHNCLITITAPSDSKIQLQFTTFDLEGNDNIQISDGTLNVISQFSGNKIPSAITTQTNGILIRFIAEIFTVAGVTNKWKATFTVVKNQGPAALQQALTSIGYNVDCRSDPNFGKYVTNSTTCITPNVFTCPKDVGGPVVINSAPNVQGTTAVWTQIGINSFTPGTDCTLGGVKTKVSAFRPWIDTFIV